MADRPSTPLAHVSIYRLQNVTKAEEALASDVKPEIVSAGRDLPSGTKLFYQQRPQKTVGWHKYLAPQFPRLPELKSRQADAVMVFPVKTAWYALSFGRGMGFLSDASIEPDFGFQVALRICDPDRLSMIDYRQIEDRTRIGRVKLSEDGSVNAFRLDTDTDLLRGVTGPCLPGFPWERVSATGPALSLSVRSDVAGLVQVGSQLQAARKKQLHPDLRWVDHVRRVRAPAQKQELDEELCRLIDAGKLAHIRLSIPDIREDGVSIEGRFVKPDGPAFQSDVRVYLAARPRDSADTVETMKRHDVHLFDMVKDAVYEKLAVYRCVVAEITLARKQYLLIDGEWFGLDKSYVDDVNQAIRSIPVLDMSKQLRHWRTGEKEGDYNSAVCTAATGLAPLDRKTLTIGDRYSKIEPADWLSTDRVFGHVKRRDKNSSGLSHVFAQGLVAGDVIRNDEVFRKRVANLLTTAPHSRSKAALAKSTFSTDGWTIAYVILGADRKAPGDDLPFFSKVNLRKQRRQVENLGYKCALVGA